MGDCLLLTGPVRALKEEFPGFRISVLVEPRFAPCFDGNPDFTEVLPATGKYATGASLLTRRTPPNLRGGVVAVDRVIQQIAKSLAPALMGALLLVANLDAVFWCLAAMAALGAMGLMAVSLWRGPV